MSGMALVTDNVTLRTILTEAKTIAVVGMSDKPWRDSHMVAGFLIACGYRVIPVNPTITTVMGLTAAPSLESIREPVDIVNVFRRAEYVPAIVESSISIGASTVWLQSGVVNEAAAARGAEAGLNIVMDHCIRVAYVLLMR